MNKEKRGSNNIEPKHCITKVYCNLQDTRNASHECTDLAA